MPKKAKELTAKQVRDLSTPGTYAVGGVDGLNIVVTPTGAKCWILRAKTGERVGNDGKVRPVRAEIGLGGFPDVTLAQARDRARGHKDDIRQGVHPLEKKRAARLALYQSQARGLTFADAAKQCHAVKSQEFKNAKHSAQWFSVLESYAFPTLARLPVADIDTPEVLAVLKPIWSEKPETASRLRQRMAAVFDWALAAKVRTAANPAAWKGCLDAQLPKTEKVKKRMGNGRKHHPALPVAELPRLMADLATRDNTSAKALRFTILTAARSGEVRLATWHEIDMNARVWRLSADRMKADKPHAVPLSDAAVAILESLPRDNPAGLVFPSVRGIEMSDMTLSKLLKDVHAADVKRGEAGYLDPVQGRIATPHGTARSTFKDWSRQNGRFPDEWSELALAHVNSDQTRAAYARGELLEERRSLMEAWGRYCEPPDAQSGVVSLDSRRL
ncbi:MAG: hypothetical protein VR73_14340 [Gammaproteobacteria bacterium BRH_c0]|nr:MAG: hypothetical protein VR73_14340 [Gammaproteobacteria bacterium BRH_c0]